MDTSKINRIEIIDRTRDVDQGGGRSYTYWSEYDGKDSKNPVVELVVQDEGRTLKVFISERKK